MDDFAGAFSAAFRLIATLDPGLAEIVVLSLRVSLTAVGPGRSADRYPFPSRTTSPSPDAFANRFS